MKHFILTFAIFFMGASLFAQITEMKVRETNGNVVTFLISEIDSVYYTVSTFTCGDNITDIDGNTYSTVEIGTQCWIGENLKVTHYPNGDPIPLVTDNNTWADLADDNTSDAYSYYNNNANNEADTYGALYTYAAAIGDDWQRDNSSTNGEGGQGVCPDGWHLPTNAEWTTLTNYLDTNVGSKLAGNEALWQNDSLEQSTDFGTSGFSALPGGKREYDDGMFYSLGNYGYWWSTAATGGAAGYRVIYYNHTNVGSYFYGKSDGFSVRCVRD